MRVAKKIMWMLLISFVLFALVSVALGGDENIKKLPKSTVEGYISPGKTSMSADNTIGASVAGVIKWEETFDDTIPPPGWFTVDNDGGGAGFEYVGLVSYTSGDSVPPLVGQAFWHNNFENGSGANGEFIDDWVITPRLPVLEEGDSLYIHMTGFGLDFPDTVLVWVSVTDSTLLNFDTQVALLVDPGPLNEWHRYAIDITLEGALVGLAPFVGINHYHLNGGPLGAGSNNVHVDWFILANGGISSIGDDAAVQPSDFVLKQNYPNPFNPTTTIAYDLYKSADVTIKIYNLAGQEVKTLVNEKQPAGARQATWDGRDNNGYKVASGVYLYRLQVGNVVQTKKMVLLK